LKALKKAFEVCLKYGPNVLVRSLDINKVMEEVILAFWGKGKLKISEVGEAYLKMVFRSVFQSET
jgi:hypothetical protein